VLVGQAQAGKQITEPVAHVSSESAPESMSYLPIYNPHGVECVRERLIEDCGGVEQMLWGENERRCCW
jgi:hypothetical protein